MKLICCLLELLFLLIKITRLREKKIVICFGIFAAVVYMDEDDVGLYTIKTIDDPRTLNKTLNIRPPENILSQRELVEKWEKLSGKELQKISISEKDWIASMKGKKESNTKNLLNPNAFCIQYFLPLLI